MDEDFVLNSPLMNGKTDALGVFYINIFYYRFSYDE